MVKPPRHAAASEVSLIGRLAVKARMWSSGPRRHDHRSIRDPEPAAVWIGRHHRGNDRMPRRADFRAQNRLDFRRLVRIGVVMGGPSQSRPLKGSPRDLRGFGRASVKSSAANQRSLNMSTPSIAKSRNLKTAPSKKRSIKSSATARRKVTSAAAAAKTPLKSDEPKAERVTKQERLPRAGGATGSTPFFAFPEGRTIRLVHDDCALSRTPSMSPTSFFLPSGVAPMITSRHCAASLGRACTWMPSTQK
jgi:hypothetical protein